MATITEAKIIVTSPGRNFVTLKITTSDGVTGLGDATLNGRELAVAHYLQDHVAPLLPGRDPDRIEDMWQYLYKGAYWRRGPVTMTAIAAVDTALWDIKGKVAGMPVYDLLGGRARDSAMVYGHASGATLPALLDDVERFQDLGYRAVRVQAAVPGLSGTYGVRHGTVYEPAGGSLPEEQVWSTEAYLDFAPHYLAAVREKFGSGLHLLHDVHHRLTPTEAAHFGRRVEDLRLFWMEDPTPAEAQESFRGIRQATTTPIAVGEVFNSVWDCQQLITERLIDYIRASVVHAGGITHLRRIFNLAELYQVRTGSHGATDLSPVSMAAAVHLDVTVPNFGVQEYMEHDPLTHEVFRPAYEL
ncbi:MAG TPA: D-mannonate dehydratase ManD, partial [Streptomyces sp.]|nr:D-mannonate dehydratase ManD [Streptomyces sp.]